MRPQKRPGRAKMASFDSKSQVTGGVVILGVQGSGKTVFLSVLGETFAEGGVLGLSLGGDPATEDFTAETFRLMEWEHQFPESTDRTVSIPLRWKVRVGDQNIFSLATLDCAGELIVDAFAPGAEKREASENNESADEENAFAQASQGAAHRKTAIDRLRELVQEAKVICLFVNPADFKRNQRLDGTRRQRDAAFRRYRDMDRLLDVFLRGDAAGSRPIVIVLTQTGAESLRNEIAYHGGPKGYLFDAYPKLRKLKRAIDAQVICVSAVNEEVQTGERTWEDDTGQSHAEPIMGPAPAFTSTGLVDFLLAIGGEVSSDFAPLGRALGALRDADSRLADARFSGRPSCERLKAAQALSAAWEAYDAAVGAFLDSHPAANRFADEVRATAEHRAAEKAAAQRWLFAEPLVNAALREGAYAGRTLPEEEEAQSFGREIAARINDGQPTAIPVSADLLFPVAGWLKDQLREFQDGQTAARENIEQALALDDLAAARQALEQGRLWYPLDCRDLDDWSAKIAALVDIIARRGAFAAVDERLDEALSALRRKEPLSAARAMELAAESVRALAADAQAWGDAGEVAARENRLTELETRRAAVEDELAAQALAERQAKFRQSLREAFERAREKVMEENFDEVEEEKSRITAMAKEEPWGMAVEEAEAVVREIAACVAARKARRRKIRLAIAACVLLFLLGLWALLRISAINTCKAEVASAREAALAGDFAAARTHLLNVVDIPFLGINRAVQVDPFLERAVALGCEDKGAFEETTKAASDGLEEVRQEFSAAQEAKVPDLAPEQWREALRAFDAASEAFPRLDLNEFGLPRSREDYQEALDGFGEVLTRVPEATQALARACSAAEAVRAEISRKEEVARLRRRILAVSPSHGWGAILERLPEDLGEWLNLPDAKLADKWEKSCGKDAEWNWNEVEATFASFAEKATEEEKNEFRAENANVAAVMDAANRVWAEQSRRRNFRADLASVQAKMEKVNASDLTMCFSDLKALSCQARLDGERQDVESVRAAFARAVSAEVKDAIASGGGQDVVAEALALEGEPFVSEIQKTLRTAIERRWPDKPVAGEDVDWDSLSALCAKLERGGSSGKDCLVYLRRAFGKWREPWMKAAEASARAAARASSVRARVTNVLGTERQLVWILRGEEILKPEEKDSFRHKALACRTSLPPVLQVSLYYRSPVEGGRYYVDAGSFIKSPGSVYYSSIVNSQTGKDDAFISIKPGSIMVLELTGDGAVFSGDGIGHSGGRKPCAFDWNGVRHIDVSVDADAQDWTATPLERLLDEGR